MVSINYRVDFEDDEADIIEQHYGSLQRFLSVAVDHEIEKMMRKKPKASYQYEDAKYEKAEEEKKVEVVKDGDVSKKDDNAGVSGQKQ